MKKQIISAICAVGMLATVSAGFSAVSAAATSYVLTNNRLEEFHPGMTNLNTGLSYQIVSDNSGSQGGQIVNNDTACTKLTDGNYSTSGSYATVGGWDSDYEVYIIADIQTDAYITGAEFYAKGAANVDILYSTDGETYTSLGNVAEATTSHDSLTQYSVSCEATKARYIKFYSNRSGNQEIIAEIVVKGYLPDSSKVLTNNATTSFYADMTNLDTGLSYQIISDNSGSQGGQIVNNDPNCTKLTDGISSVIDGLYMTTGGWDSDGTVTVTADAKTNVYITGADFFASGAANVEISYSTDGETYTSLGSVTETTSGGAVKFSVNCTPKLARYIRFVSNRSGNQEKISEIVVKGYPAAFSFGGTKFNSATSTFSGVLVNEPEVDAVASKVITAVYDAEGRFVAAKTAPVTVDANSSQGFSADLSGVPIGNGYKIKSYAWNSDNQYLTVPAEYTYTVE